LIDRVGPKKIDVIEGSGEWLTAGMKKKGVNYGNSYDTDGFTVKWREFGKFII